MCLKCCNCESCKKNAASHPSQQTPEAKTLRDEVAEVLGWTPDFLKSMENLRVSCTCGRTGKCGDEPAVDCYNRQLDEITALLDRRLAEVAKGYLEAVGEPWPEPDEKAGEGSLGPLFISGLLTQYEADRKKHNQARQYLLAFFRSKGVDVKDV